MPSWLETETEIRYRIRAPDVFMSGSFRVSPLQKTPPVEAIVGRIKGEDQTTTQEVRFPSEDWDLEDAKRWIGDHEEKILKMATELTTAFLEKGNLSIQALSFLGEEFTEKAVQDWLLAKNMDIAELKNSGKSFDIQVQEETRFIKGSLRDIKMRDGLIATVGTLTREFQKSIQKRVPDRFSLSAENLTELIDIDVTEVTLTRAPAVGKMAEFSIVKSANLENSNRSEENYLDAVPLTKIDSEKKQVGGYVLVPDIPDWQGDIASSLEIEKAAYKFMKNLAHRKQKGSSTGHEHQQFAGVGYPIESFVDKKGIYGVIGGWFLRTQITLDSVWKSVRSGEIVGYSIGGTGTRKKAVISIGDPVKKSEEGILQKIVNLIKGTPGTYPEEPKEKEEPGESKPPEDEEPEKDPENQKKEKEVKRKMELETLKKFDCKASELEELEKSGVDLEAAHKAVEDLAKATGMNLSLYGIGYTTIQITRAMRSNGGAWPTEIYPGTNDGSVRKSQGQDETVERIQAERAKMSEILEKAVDGMEKLDSRMAGFESRRTRTRKSVPDVTVGQDPGQEEPEQDVWKAQDQIDFSVCESDALAKSMGLYGAGEKYSK